MKKNQKGRNKVWHSTCKRRTFAGQSTILLLKCYDHKTKTFKNALYAIPKMKTTWRKGWFYKCDKTALHHQYIYKICAKKCKEDKLCVIKNDNGKSIQCWSDQDCSEFVDETSDCLVWSEVKAIDEDIIDKDYQQRNITEQSLCKVSEGKITEVESSKEDKDEETTVSATTTTTAESTASASTTTTAATTTITVCLIVQKLNTFEVDFLVFFSV